MSNANGRASTHRVSAALPAGDPMGSVLGMGRRLPPGALGVAVVLAILLHGGAAAAAGAAILFADIFDWTHAVRLSIAGKLNQVYEIEVAKEPEPPPPEPEPAKEEPKEEPKAEPPPPKEAPKEPPPPPPAAAQAGAVLTQDPPKDEPVDLTGNTFVTGSGSTFAGGVTQTGGTSTTAVYNPAAVATGVAGGTGTAPAPPPAPRVDRSRGAKIANLANLQSCPFPPEAEADQIDDAYVAMEVKVSADGRAESVTITQDPGHGFGREARRCAMRERYEPAWNADGVVIPGTYRVRFHFEKR